MDFLRDFYNRRISARWYSSWVLIGGWLTSMVLLLPDMLDYAAAHWDYFGGLLMPKFSLETKALVLFVYVNFIAPPLRAFVQRKMQQAQILQQAEQGKVIPLPASGVSTTSVVNSTDGNSGT